jgi:hypothetical protein
MDIETAPQDGNGEQTVMTDEQFGDLKRPCPKCGMPTPLRYLKHYRCPDCMVAETRANAAATEAEFDRLYRVEAEWGNLMADRKHLLDSLSPDAILTGDGHRALMYRRLAAVLLGCLLGKNRAAAADLTWLRDLAWNDSPLIPEDAALIDELASPELPNRNGEFP